MQIIRKLTSHRFSKSRKFRNLLITSITKQLSSVTSQKMCPLVFCIEQQPEEPRVNLEPGKEVEWQWWLGSQLPASSSGFSLTPPAKKPCWVLIEDEKEEENWQKISLFDLSPSLAPVLLVNNLLGCWCEYILEKVLTNPFYYPFHANVPSSSYMPNLA